MADIHTLPVQRKRCRRRLHRVPDRPLAEVMEFCGGRETEVTAEERLAKIEDATRRMARHLLFAIRTFREIDDVLKGD